MQQIECRSRYENLSFFLKLGIKDIGGEKKTENNAALLTKVLGKTWLL